MSFKLTNMNGNAKLIAKLLSQLTMVAMETAKGRASCLNNSETISQGIAPGPSAKLKVTPKANTTSRTPGTVAYRHG